MKSNYERDARAFGFPPAFFMSMVEHKQAHSGTNDQAYERALTQLCHLNQLLREHSEVEVVLARRHLGHRTIAVTAVVAGILVGVFALL